MKPRYRSIAAQFEPETRFTLAPVVRGARPEMETELEQLKSRLVRRLIVETTRPSTRVRIRQAVNDATALAWSTGSPLLLLPVLAEELAANARQQAAKQECVRERSKSLLPELDGLAVKPGKVSV